VCHHFTASALVDRYAAAAAAAVVLSLIILMPVDVIIEAFFSVDKSVDGR